MHPQTARSANPVMCAFLFNKVFIQKKGYGTGLGQFHWFFKSQWLPRRQKHFQKTGKCIMFDVFIYVILFDSCFIERVRFKHFIQIKEKESFGEQNNNTYTKTKQRCRCLTVSFPKHLAFPNKHLFF